MAETVARLSMGTDDVRGSGRRFVHRNGTKRHKRGCVYLIQAGDMPRFKIGCAINPEKRIRELQTSSPVRLRLIGWKQSIDMVAEERRWHAMFHDTRRIGEWFDLSANQLVKLVARMKNEKLAIHFEKRKAPRLVVGKHYFISFNSRKIREVILMELPETEGTTASVRGIKCGSVWSLYPDEIRETEIEALINCVTF